LIQKSVPLPKSRSRRAGCACREAHAPTLGRQAQPALLTRDTLDQFPYQQACPVPRLVSRPISRSWFVQNLSTVCWWGSFPLLKKGSPPPADPFFVPAGDLFSTSKQSRPALSPGWPGQLVCPGCAARGFLFHRRLAIGPSLVMQTCLTRLRPLHVPDKRVVRATLHQTMCPVPSHVPSRSSTLARPLRMGEGQGEGQQLTPCVPSRASADLRLWTRDLGPIRWQNLPPFCALLLPIPSFWTPSPGNPGEGGVTL
jgi:hypothetical protein